MNCSFRKLASLALGSLIVVLTPLNGTILYQFQDGLNGYTGTADTSMQGRSSSGTEDRRNFGATTSLRIHNVLYNTSTGVPTIGSNGYASVLRFDDIFGLDEGQIDPSLEVVSATLNLTAFSRSANSAGAAWRIGALMVPFVEGTASASFQAGSTSMLWRISPENSSFTPENPGTGILWSNYNEDVNKGVPGAGVDFHATGAFHTTVPVWAPGEYTSGTPTLTDPFLYQIDITAIVEAWRTGDLANHGLLLFSTGSGATNVQVRSSDSTIQSERPLLAVVVVPEPIAVAGLFGILMLGLVVVRRLRRGR